MKNDTLFRQNFTSDSKEINQFLSNTKEKYFANHFLLDTNFVNIYFQNKLKFYLPINILF
jgi:hypothetical protein